MIGKPIFILNENIDWEYFSQNPNAIYILENNLDKIQSLSYYDNITYQSNLSRNPNGINLLSKLNYDLMKKNMKEFNEELVANVFNPKRLLKICEEYNIDFYEIQDIY